MKLDIDTVVQKRNKYIINNEYELIKNRNDDFHHVIYYLSEKKIEIIVRKLNDKLGWNYDLKLKIISDNKPYIISIGSSEDNFKIIELYVNYKIEHREHKKLCYIPKKIIQTNYDICKNLAHYNTTMSILEKNPDYEYKFFNDIESRNFIKDNFIINLQDNSELNNDISDVLKTYDLLICGALKADLFRYCYLYIHGGIYLDSKISNYIDLDKIINEDDKYVICSDDAYESLYNGIMIIEKNNFKLLQMIKEIINNVENKNYLNNIHEPTGNMLYYKYFNDKKCIMDKKVNNVYFNNKVAFKCDYIDYYKSDYNDFRKDYINKNYYYIYNLYIMNYMFSFGKDIRNNIFTIFHLKDNIFVLKNNNNTGWDNTININMFNMLNGVKRVIKIDKSKDSENVFTL